MTILTQYEDLTTLLEARDREAQKMSLFLNLVFRNLEEWTAPYQKPNSAICWCTDAEDRHQWPENMNLWVFEYGGVTHRLRLLMNVPVERHLRARDKHGTASVQYQDILSSLVTQYDRKSTRHPVVSEDFQDFMSMSRHHFEELRRNLPYLLQMQVGNGGAPIGAGIMVRFLHH